MKSETRLALRSIPAILFLAVIGAVLARPIFNSNDDQAEGPPPPSTKTTESPTPRSAPTKMTSRLELVDRYPRRCLRRVPRPTGIGLIAAVDGRRVSVGTLTSVVATFPGDAPIGWSASGRYLALKGSEVWDSATETKQRLIDVELTEWAWSPIADCLVGSVGERRLVALSPEARPTTLARGDLSSDVGPAIELSQNGRFLLFQTLRPGPRAISTRSL